MREDRIKVKGKHVAGFNMLKKNLEAGRNYAGSSITGLNNIDRLQ